MRVSSDEAKIHESSQTLVLSRKEIIARKPSTIRIEKFGPLRNVEIVLKKRRSLNLIYGLPASGKSFLMKLLYSILKLPIIKTINYELNQRLNPSKDFKEALYHVFGDDAFELWNNMRIEVESDCGYLSIDEGRVIWEAKCLRLPEKSENIVMRPPLIRGSYYGPWEYWLKNVDKSLAVWYATLISQLFPTFAVMREYRGPGESVKAVVPPTSLYLPAGRCAILSTYSLTSLMTFERLGAPIQMLYVPFIEAFETSLEAIEYGHSKLSDIEMDLVKELLLGGNIIREANELFFQQGDKKVRLYNAAGGVLENGSLALALLGLVSAKQPEVASFIFIEEPEAQLHPKLQRLVLRFLALLTNHNLTVFVTTHSAFLATEAIILNLSKKLPDTSSYKEFKKYADKLTDTEIRIYHTHEGHVREVSIDEYLEAGILSIAEEADEQLSLLDELLAAISGNEKGV